MTTQTSAVGALTLPYEAARVEAALADPVVDALLDFLAWSLCQELDDRLATLNGTSSTAVPTNSRYAYNPLEPTNRVRFRPPALFCWWDGNSTSTQWTMLQRLRTRSVKALYVFQELPSLSAMNQRRGLFNAVDSAFERAADRDGHPLYSYAGKPAGTELSRSVGADLWEWSYVGGKGITRVQLGEPLKTVDSPTANRQQMVGRDFPAFAAEFQVRELVELPQPEDSTDVLIDSAFSISHDGVEILDRTMLGTDGTDVEDIV